MTRKPVIIMLTAALLMSVAAWGQSLPKFKFGEPTMEELKMTTYDKDSSGCISCVYHGDGLLGVPVVHLLQQPGRQGP